MKKIANIPFLKGGNFKVFCVGMNLKFLKGNINSILQHFCVIVHAQVIDLFSGRFVEQKLELRCDHIQNNLCYELC